MNKAQQNFVVMFADVAGSTRLYERLGDFVANQMIGGAITLAIDVIKNHQGVVVKTIGDEVMCRFLSADKAILCACEIHEMMEQQPVNNGVGLVFRIGLNWGPAILQSDGDIFGDAVNLAARMAGVAKARQTITTEFVKQKLSLDPLIAKCREIDSVHVKGKSEEISIIEVMWESNNVTRMSTIISDNIALINERPLSLCYQNKTHLLDAGSEVYTFGRDKQCDFTIDSNLVSRFHANITSRRGKFILEDESTNGTYVQMDNANPIFLRREEISLHGKGVVSFGKQIDMNNKFLLHFDFLDRLNESESSDINK